MSSLHTALLTAFLALLLVAPWAYYVLPLLAVAVCFVSLGRAGFGLSLDREDGLCLAALALFAVLWCLDVARTGQWPVGEGNQGLFLPLWPLLAVLIGCAWRRWPPTAEALWYGAAIGAALAGLVAIHEFGWLGRPRAGRSINSIPFGNLALLLSTLSVLAFLARRGRTVDRREHLIRGFFGVAALLGVMASVLSGTRGGWWVFPVLLGVVYLAFGSRLPRRRSWLLGGLMASLLAAGLLVPQIGVQQRVDQAVENLADYTRGDASSSLGVRLEMWRAGGRLFLEKPLLGWGEGRLEARRDQWVAKGLYHRGISQYDQLHNDFVDTAARRGLLGLISLLLLYGVPLLLFARRLCRRHDREGRVLATAGLVVIAAFVGFGLSQSMLRDVRGLSGYLGLVTACWCLLKSVPHGGNSAFWLRVR